MYYDLLSKIKNAGQAGKTSITFPLSKMDFEIAKVLTKSGYLKDVEKKVINRRNFLEMKLAFHDNKPVLGSFKIFSRPGRRFYVSSFELKQVKNGYGLGILSTSKGIMDNRKARKNKIG